MKLGDLPTRVVRPMGAAPVGREKPARKRGRPALPPGEAAARARARRRAWYVRNRKRLLAGQAAYRKRLSKMSARVGMTPPYAQWAVFTVLGDAPGCGGGFEGLVVPRFRCGHEKSPANTFVNKWGSREIARCRACKNAATARYRNGGAEDERSAIAFAAG